MENENLNKSVAVDDALAFAEYFRNNFDYCDCNASGRVYKWIDLSKRGQPAMTMKKIFDDWQSRQQLTANGSALRSGGNLKNRCSDMHFCPTDAKHIVIGSARVI